MLLAVSSLWNWNIFVRDIYTLTIWYLPSLAWFATIRSHGKSVGRNQTKASRTSAIQYCISLHKSVAGLALLLTKLVLVQKIIFESLFKGSIYWPHWYTITGCPFDVLSIAQNTVVVYRLWATNICGCLGFHFIVPYSDSARQKVAALHVFSTLSPTIIWNRSYMNPQNRYFRG